MAERKRKVRAPSGDMVDATLLSVNATAEYWNEYLVEDGTVIKIKLVAMNVYRIDDAYDPHGDPIYTVESQTIVTVNAPEKLRKRDQ